MRSPRLTIVGLLVAALVAPGTAAAASTDGDQPPASVQERTPAAEAAFRDVTRCLNSGQSPSLSVAYLVDLSASLTQYELKETLTEVLSNSIDQLDRFSSREIVVNYTVVGFGLNSDVLVPWTTVDGSSQTDVVADALRSSRIDGSRTDYERGLREAAAQLALQPDSCRMLIWMTDGAIQLLGGFDAELESLERMCRTGISRDGLASSSGEYGLMSELRQAGIPVFGVFFTNERLREELEDPLRWKIDFLRALVEGRGEIREGFILGGQELPSFPLDCAPVDDQGVSLGGAANGALIESEDPVALAFDFFRLEAGLLGGSGNTVAPDGTFTVSPGTAYLRLIARSPDVTVTRPDGTPVMLESTAVTQSGGAVSIEIDVDPSQWGEWRVEVEGSAIVYLFTGLTLTLDRDLGSSILSGVENSLTGKIVPEAGRDVVVTPTLKEYFPEWGSVQTEIVAGGTEANLSGSLSDTGVFTVSGLVPDSADEIELRVSMPLGGAFDPIESTFRLQVVDSSAFAFPTQKVLELSPLEGPEGVASDVLTVQAPAEGAGPATFCVAEGWVRLEDTPAAVNETGRPESTFERTVVGSTEGCFEVQPGVDLQVPIEVRNSDQLNSQVDAAITVTSTSADGVEYSEPIALSFESRTQQNPWIVAAAIILLLVLGLGLPLIALWVWNRVATKFAPVEGVTRAVYPVRIQRSGRIAVIDGRRETAGQKIIVAPNDFSYVTPQPSSTTFDAQRGAMYARVPWFPLTASWFEWAAPAGQRIVAVVPGSTKQTAPIAEHRAAEVAPDVSRAWALLISDAALASDESEIDGELVVFSEMQSDVRHYQRRIDDILLTPGLSEALDAAAHAARTAPAVGAEADPTSVPVGVGVGATNGATVGSGAPVPPSGAPVPAGGAPQQPSRTAPVPPTEQGRGAPPSGPLAPPAPPSAGPLAPPPPPA
jgi:hypothetical protein